MIFRVDEDRIVGACCHAGLAADANRLVEVYDAIRALEHCGGGARDDARGMRALVTARDLVSASRVGKLAYVNMLDVSARDRERDFILGLTGSGARVTSDATSVIDDFRPLNRFTVGLIQGKRSHLRRILT